MVDFRAHDCAGETRNVVVIKPPVALPRLRTMGGARSEWTAAPAASRVAWAVATPASFREWS